MTSQQRKELLRGWFYHFLRKSEEMALWRDHPPYLPVSIDIDEGLEHDGGEYERP